MSVGRGRRPPLLGGGREGGEEGGRESGGAGAVRGGLAAGLGAFLGARLAARRPAWERCARRLRLGEESGYCSASRRPRAEPGAPRCPCPEAGPASCRGGAIRGEAAAVCRERCLMGARAAKRPAPCCSPRVGNGCRQSASWGSS